MRPISDKFKIINVKFYRAINVDDKKVHMLSPYIVYNMCKITKYTDVLRIHLYHKFIVYTRKIKICRLSDYYCKMKVDRKIKSNVDYI